MKLPALTVDCANGNGTIDGFDFADEGVIDIVGFDPTALEQTAAITFANVSAETLAKLNLRTKWKVKSNSKLTDSLSVMVKSDGVTIKRKGLVLVVR